MSSEDSNPSELYSEVPHYREPERTYQVDIDARLPVDIYSQALDHLVIACVDLVFTHQQQVLLAKRRTIPKNLGGSLADA